MKNMKVGILAGGAGTRFGEQTRERPKALIEIGGRPILWHILRYYAHFGFNHFAIALGYRGDDIKRYFLDYHRLAGDVRVSTRGGIIEQNAGVQLDWTIDLCETGDDTPTGGRIRRLLPALGREAFLLTWCDGLADVDLHELVAFHQRHRRLATVTAVQPRSRFGRLTIDGDRVTQFAEKPIEQDWINGAYFVLEPGVRDYIDGDDVAWEQGPLERLARDGQLMAYRHRGFWQCMDTPQERQQLEQLWSAGAAPWKRWSDDP